MVLAVTADDALRDVKGYAAAWRIAFSPHARQRMRQRNARPADVRHALMTASSCAPSRDGGGRWVVPGVDLDGDELVAVVAFEAGLLVVTIF
jgi:hypothetical protein